MIQLRRFLLLRRGLLRPLRPLLVCMQGSNAGEKINRPCPSRGRCPSAVLLLLRSGLLCGRGCRPAARAGPVGCLPAAGCCQARAPGPTMQETANPNIPCQHLQDTSDFFVHAYRLESLLVIGAIGCRSGLSTTKFTKLAMAS